MKQVMYPGSSITNPFNKTLSIGQDTMFYGDLLMYQPVAIGEFCFVGPKAKLFALRRPLFIGKDVQISHGVEIVDCTIKDDVWIGFNSMICRGITIHQGAVVGAGSFVINDVEEYSIVAGNPATRVGWAKR